MQARSVALAVAVVGLFDVSAVQAAIIGYGNRAAFGAAVAGLDTVLENWDSFADGTVVPNGSTVNGITYNSSTGDALVTNNFLPLSSPNGLGRTGVGFFLSSDSITFSFGVPVVAFGININTFATNDGAYRLTTNLGDTALSGYDPFPGSQTGQFVGLVSDAPLSSLTLSGFSTDQTFTLDDLTYAPVPEPGTLLLLASGMIAGLGRLRRRR